VQRKKKNVGVGNGANEPSKTGEGTFTADPNKFKWSGAIVTKTEKKMGA